MRGILSSSWQLPKPCNSRGENNRQPLATGRELGVQCLPLGRHWLKLLPVQLLRGYTPWSFLDLFLYTSGFCVGDFGGGRGWEYSQ